MTPAPPRIERRRILEAIAASTTSGMVALAGCGGPEGGDGGDGGDDGVGGDGDGEEETTTEAATETEPETETGTEGETETTTAGDGETIAGSEYPAVDDWLTESEVGDAAPNYDGEIVDETGSDDVTVQVGVGENGFAFGPPAVAVSSGTTVTWEWTGEGGQHNVNADPDNQIGESDFSFRSGDPVEGEGETFERSFDETGVALYHCEPHLAVGMKGAVVVTE